MIDFIANFFNSLWAFLDTVPEMFNQLMIKGGAWIVIAWTKAKITFVGYSWMVAKEIIQQLNISDALTSAWSGLDSEVLGYVTFLKIPEALNMILNAYVTRYVMSVLS